MNKYLGDKIKEFCICIEPPWVRFKLCTRFPLGTTNYTSNKLNCHITRKRILQKPFNLRAISTN